MLNQRSEPSAISGFFKHVDTVFWISPSRLRSFSVLDDMVL